MRLSEFDLISEGDTYKMLFYLLSFILAISNDMEVENFYPKKGNTDGGYQFFVQLKSKEDLPLWIKIGEEIRSAVAEGYGLYYVWTVQHENGKVNVEISRDGIQWQHIGEFKFENESPLKLIFIITILGAVIFAGFESIKKYIRKTFKKRSDNGERKRFINSPL